MLISIGDTETQYHLIQKSRSWQISATLPEVFTSVKHQLIDSRGQRLAFEHGIITAAIIVGDRSGQRDQLILITHTEQFDLDSMPRAAMSRIQYMRCQSSHLYSSIHPRQIPRLLCQSVKGIETNIPSFDFLYYILVKYCTQSIRSDL